MRELEDQQHWVDPARRAPRAFSGGDLAGSALLPGDNIEGDAVVHELVEAQVEGRTALGGVGRLQGGSLAAVATPCGIDNVLVHRPRGWRGEAEAW